MKNFSLEEGIHKIVLYFMIAWGILFIPAMIMLVLIFNGHGNFVAHTEASWMLMYYNILVFPLVMLGSSIFSWLLLKKKKYKGALIVILLPLLNVLLELIAADLILFFM